MFDVIVLGAGFAGLTAATELSRQGARVLVLEARPGLGGRASAYTDPETGETVDNGQHLLLGCYHETFAFLRRIGAEAFVRVEASLEVPMVDERGVMTRLSCPSLPSPLHLLAGVLDWDALGLRDRLSVLRMGRVIRLARQQAAGRAVLAASPGETVENWLIRNGQSPRIRQMLWDPLALAALNQLPSEAAAPVFARVLGQMFGPDARDSAIGLPLKPLNELYAVPSRDYIVARGGEVRTGATASLRMEGARVSVGVRQESLSAPVVIVAVPWYALSNVFVDRPGALADVIDRADRTPASPIVTVNLWLDRRVLDGPLLGLPGRTFQWVFDKRLAFGEQASHLSLVSSGAAAVVGWPNDQLVATAVAELSEGLPVFRAAEVLRATVVRERRATFSLAPGVPPRPGTATPVRGLFLAGDWIDTGLPGTIESAVLSGHRAASLAATP